ncbi:MAG: carboxypeptidase-like regulatory domain-containing protein [Flavobacteriales bacterium]|nr:MAG: carboxypeptidase-like regulatory domain-containing protein [Flavobacteriales bacterium]
MYRTLIIAVLSIFFHSISFGQVTIQGKIIDSDGGNALAFANIEVVGLRQGTVSDLEGRFKLEVERLPVKLRFSYIGYQPKAVDVSSVSTKLEISLEVKSGTLEGVTVLAGVNPALRLIRGVMENREKNDHEYLKSYRCRSYNRLRLGPRFIYSDSILPPKETWTDDYRELSSMDFFLSESVGTRTYRRPGKAVEDIEATRTSGFQQPLFAIFATQLQSFTFYDPSFSLVGLEYLSPLNKRMERYYQYRLVDTLLVNDGRDTVYTVAFEPQPGRQFQAMKGRIQIQTPDMAIRSVFAEPVKIPGQDFEVQIRQLYEKNGVWFPTQLDADIVFNRLQVESSEKVDTAGTVTYSVYVHGEVRSYFTDLEVERDKPFSVPIGISARIADDAAKRDSVFWSQNRTEELTSKDSATYVIIDSLSESINLERIVNVLATLADGYLRFGKFDFDLNRLLRINSHEGVYLGVGGVTNENLSKRIQFDAFGGYGFGDSRFKYGYGARIRLGKAFWLRGGYSFDIEESGGSNFQVRTRGTLLENTQNLRRFYVDVFDEVSAAFLEVEFHPVSIWQNRIRLQRENRFLVGADYFFSEPAITGAFWQNGFTYTNITYEGRWAPRERFLENRGRRQLVEPAYPIFRYLLEQNIPEWSVDAGSITRAEAKVDFLWSNPYRGVLSMRFQGGLTEGVAPYQYLFSPLSNLRLYEDRWIGYSTIGDPMAFETVGFNEFLFQRYASGILSWNTKQLAFRRNTKFPEMVFLSKFMYGQAPEQGAHIGLPVESGAVTEFGIEFLRLIGGIGIGIYHRPDANAPFPWVIKLRI